jgi:hypothetical protein
MNPILHDFNQARRDLFPFGQGLEELVPEQLHDVDGIRARDGNKRSICRNKAVGDQTVEMGMKAGGIVTIALQRGDQADTDSDSDPDPECKSIEMKDGTDGI